MSCPHSVLESVEFAEGDSFLCSPDANHHIEGFDIIGSVVLWVIYLFHIPYQMFCAKIEKHSSFRNGEGFEKPKQLTLHKVNKKDPYARILIKKKNENKN